MSISVRRYRRRLPELNAVQVTVENIAGVAAWCGGQVVRDETGRPVRVTLGRSRFCAGLGDYVAEEQGADGSSSDFYPIAGRLFERTHDELLDEGGD